MKLEFKPEDFCAFPNAKDCDHAEVYECYGADNADIANARLAEMLKEAPLVFKVIETHGWQTQASLDYQFSECTKTYKAQLVCIEEIGK